MASLFRKSLVRATACVLVLFLAAAGIAWRRVASAQSTKPLETMAGGVAVFEEEFADMCGLDRTYIGGIERGERNVGLVNVEKIVPPTTVRSTLVCRISGG
jgi:transcriptional regulator with XRE-family HTH domain